MTRTFPGALVGLATRAGAVLAFLQAYALPWEWNRGPAGRWWEPLRRTVSRGLGVVDERAGPRPITRGEYAGWLDLSLPAAERLLRSRGFVRNPFSRLKVRDGRPEAGSWVRRDGPFARRQLHVMLFRSGDGVDVYAHEEPSNANPAVGADHYDGSSQRVAAGVRAARATLPLDVGDAPTDPPAGSWDSAHDAE